MPWWARAGRRAHRLVPFCCHLFPWVSAVPSSRKLVRQSRLSHRRIRGDDGKSASRKGGRIHPLCQNLRFPNLFWRRKPHEAIRLPVLCRFLACRRASGRHKVHKSLQWCWDAGFHWSASCPRDISPAVRRVYRGSGRKPPFVLFLYVAWITVG